MPPKNSKKKKNKDFQKVKLKVGRKVQKSANETVPQVRVGRIQIKSQYKPGTDQPTKKRKYDITELLSQCWSLCPTTRQSALSSLHSFFDESPELLSENFTTVERAITPLFVDKDHDVRSKTRKLLKHILLSSDRAAKFDAHTHPLLLLSLCRAMTHIQEDIQLDSLLILDIYVEHCPLLVVTGSAKLIEDFLPLISRQHLASSGAEKVGGAGGVRGPQSAKGRSLLVNPNSKLASQKWRVKVLERLTRMLTVLVNHNKTRTKVGGDAPRSPRYSWNARSGSSGDMDSLLGDASRLRSAMNTLVPLLIDCWIETGITNLTHESSNLDKTSAEIVENVLAVLHPLLSIFVDSVEDQTPQNQWLNKNFCKKIVKYFMSKFPYRISVRGATKKRAQDDEGPRQSFQEKSTMVNLSICAVMSYLIEPVSPSSPDDGSSEWIDNIADYIVDRLSERNHRLTREQFLLVFRLVETLSRKHLREDRREALLRACVHVEHKPMTDSWKDCFDFFFRLCLQPFSIRGLCSSPSVQEWIARLPQLLYVVGCEGHKDLADILAAVCLAGRQQHSAFLLQFTEHLDKYLEREFLRNLSSELQERFAHSFVWLTGLETLHFKQMSSLVLDSTLSLAAFSCICESLVYRLTSSYGDAKTEDSYQGFRSVDFMNMLITVSVGSNEESLVALDSEYHSQCYSQPCSWIVSDEKRVSELVVDWPRQSSLILFVFGILRRMSCCADVHRVVKDFIRKFLLKHKVMSLLSGCSLVVIITILDDMLRQLEEHSVPDSLNETLPSAVDSLLAEICSLLRRLSPSLSIDVNGSPALLDANVSAMKRVLVEVFAKLFLRHPVVFCAYVDDLEKFVQDDTTRVDSDACVVALRELLGRDDDVKEMSRCRWPSIKKMFDAYDARNSGEKTMETN